MSKKNAAARNKNMGVNGASVAEYAVARDEVDAIHINNRIKRSNGRAKLEEQEARRVSKVWKPGDPLPASTKRP